MYLSNLFIEHFRKFRTTTTIINITLDLAFVPAAFIPIYSATKAALHSFTMTLRYQLMNEIKTIQVCEIVPPAVQTNLGGSHEPLDEFCQTTFERLEKGEQEIGYKMSDEARRMKSREDSDRYFMNFNDNMKKIFGSVKH